MIIAAVVIATIVIIAKRRRNNGHQQPATAMPEFVSARDPGQQVRGNTGEYGAIAIYVPTPTNEYASTLNVKGVTSPYDELTASEI